MSFFDNRVAISNGDLILAWMNRSNIRPIVIKSGETFHTQYGSFAHDTIIGKPFGSQIPGQGGRGFIHVLAPTPELWSLSLRHRTQIVYTPDASYIVQRLKIRPGSRVLEAGTGSGSFTHALARTISTSGQLFTFEFHGPRYEEALKEIKEHKLDENTVITHRDVCMEGFSNPFIYNSHNPNAVKKILLEKAGQSIESDEIPDEQVQDINLQANAVFLDLPSPWLAIPHLSKVLDDSKEAHICCFSPCIEQVSRTVETLKKEGWRGIEMVEVSAKRWEGHKEMVKTMDDAVERLRDIKRRRVFGLRKRSQKLEKELRRKEAQAENRDSETPEAVATVTIKEDDKGNETVTDKEEYKNNGSADGDDEDSDDEKSNDNSGSTKNRGFNPWGKGLRIKEGAEGYQWGDITRIEAEIKSHTSYLTFAVKPPRIPFDLITADGVVISSIPKEVPTVVNSTPEPTESAETSVSEAVTNGVVDESA